MIRNVAGQQIGAEMVAADGTAFGGAVSVYVTKDGGAQVIGAVGGGACTAKGNGLYAYAPSQTETDAVFVEFTFVAPGAVPQTVHVYTDYPQSGDAYPTIVTIATLIAAIKAKTDNLPADPASQAAIAALIGALNNLSAAQVLASVNVALQTGIADSIPADGTAPSIAQGVYMIAQFLFERVVAGTTVTVKKPDGATTLFTLGLNNATQPTSITRST